MGKIDKMINELPYEIQEKVINYYNTIRKNIEIEKDNAKIVSRTKRVREMFKI